MNYLTKNEQRILFNLTSPMRAIDLVSKIIKPKSNKEYIYSYTQVTLSSLEKKGFLEKYKTPFGILIKLTTEGKRARDIVKRMNENKG